MLSVLIGLAVVVVAVVEWFGKISVFHALAILTGLVGVIIVLGALAERGGRYTRL